MRCCFKERSGIVARVGFIHDKLDIKILVLFVMRRMPVPVTIDQLSEACFVDGGFDYFTYAECVAELVETGHLERSETGLFSVTEKGAQQGAQVEDGIAYSVRLKADKKIAQMSQELRRNALISTHSAQGEGGYTVRLSLADGFGEMLGISILAGSQEQAEKLERNFKKNAEKIFNAVLDDLLDDYT